MNKDLQVQQKHFLLIFVAVLLITSWFLTKYFAVIFFAIKEGKTSYVFSNLNYLFLAFMAWLYLDHLTIKADFLEDRIEIEYVYFFWFKKQIISVQDIASVEIETSYKERIKFHLKDNTSFYMRLERFQDLSGILETIELPDPKPSRRRSLIGYKICTYMEDRYNIIFQRSLYP